MQDRLFNRLDEMKDQNSAFQIFNEEFDKEHYWADKMVKKIFNCAFKLSNNDYKLLIDILIDLLDLLSMFKTNNENFSTENASKIKIAAYLLKEIQNDEKYEGGLNYNKLNEFVSYLDKDLMSALEDNIYQRRRLWNE